MASPKLTRRAFLDRSLSAAVGVTAASCAVVREAGGTRPATRSPCPPAAWKKHGIVLEATEPWEDGSIQNFTSPAEPIEGGRWRIWYSAHGPKRGFTIAYAEGTPGEPLKKVPVQCASGPPADAPFALGNLPEGWKPVQVVHIPLKNGRHRIYFWASGNEIHRYLAADGDDGRRYRVIDPLRPVLYHPNDRAAHGIPSPDGAMLRRVRAMARPADEPLAVPRPISNDATMVYQRADGTFEMYSVALVPVPKGDPAYIEHDNAPGLLRVIDRYTSEDGLRFETRERVIQRDAKDPSDQQFYHLAATYTPQGLVGMLGHYRVQAQTMDLEWCFSPDGRKWDRPLRSAWLPRGDETQVDSYGIYPPSAIVPRGGRWHLFYTGVNAAHNGKHSHGTPRSAVMYATADSIWS